MPKHKYLAGGVLVTLLAIGSVFAFRPAKAEDNPNHDQQSVDLNSSDSSSTYSSEHSKEQDELEQEDSHNEDEVEMEDGLGEHLGSVSFDIEKTVLEYHSEDLNTYGDVVNALQTYNTALDQIIAQTSVSSSVSGLTDQEIALLNSIFKKHERPFDQSEARAKEIKTQIAAIIPVLQPLADQPISPLLKKVIVSALNDFKDEIRNLSNLEHYSYDVLNAELSN